MYKQITGVPNWETRETRVQIASAREDYNRSIDHLKVVKGHYRELKKANQRERDHLIKEEKIKEMFKFGKMKKKISFLPQEPCA